MHKIANKSKTLSSYESQFKYHKALTHISPGIWKTRYTFHAIVPTIVYVAITVLPTFGSAAVVQELNYTPFQLSLEETLNLLLS